MQTCSIPDMLPAVVAGERVFRCRGRDVARLSPEGRIRYSGEAAPALPDVGYSAPLPSARLLAALGALLAQDLAARLGDPVTEAPLRH